VSDVRARIADLRRWVDATGADEDVRERAFAMLSRTLPTPEECERLEAAGWAPSRLGAGWYVRGASEPCWWTWVTL
jgi:hypothetical protein